jgi:hypothetical protein
MDVSSEQALSIFSKWKDEKSPVRLIFKLLNIGGIFTGTIFKCDSSEVAMIPLGESVVSGDSSFVAISFNLADSFAFIDPRDAGEDRELVSREMEFGVFVHFSTGERCTWALLP